MSTPSTGRRLPPAPPPPSDAELARRRAAVDGLLDEVGADVLVAYGANRSGSAVPWLTGWPVTREAVLVVHRGRAGPDGATLAVGFPNHVPNARRVARGCEVISCGERTADTVAGLLRRQGGPGVVATIGTLPGAVSDALGVPGVAVDAAYARLRAVKSAEELDVLRYAAALTDASAAALLEAAVPGATELDLVAAVEASYAGTGATNHIHYVAATSMSEPDRCAPGQWPTDRALAAGSAVVFELSTTWGPDMPGQLLRTLTVDAEPSPLYRDLHDVAEQALAAMVATLRPGALPADVVAAAGCVLDAGFTTVDDLLHGFGGGYLPPVLSHRAAPSGRDAEPLRAGMTVVVQPNVCTTDLRAGVQTGELFVITDDGARSLHDFPPGLLRTGRRTPAGLA